MKLYIKSAVPVLGQAMRRRDLGDWIEPKTRPLLDALAQLWLFPEAKEVHHWRVEVWNKFPEMAVIKGNHKLPSKQFILDNSWNIYKNSLRARLRGMIIKKHELTPDKYRERDFQGFYNVCEEYFDWLASTLSKTDTLDPDEVYDKLIDLGL